MVISARRCVLPLHRRPVRTYFADSSSTILMYASMAASLLVPFRSAHACHLALPFRSNMPGFSVSLSPTVACLNSAYSSSSSASLGRLVKLFTFSADSLNFCNRKGWGMGGRRSDDVTACDCSVWMEKNKTE
uniref:Uncharacterized protein n=1 Tax=Anopheles melas TaxID=34690 RepID=A0A182UJS1_9DIPT